MNEIANVSMEFIVWVLRVALVGMIYLFVWRIFRAMIRGDQNVSLMTATLYLVLQNPGATLLPRNKIFEVYDNYVIGRGAEQNIVLNDSKVSYQHAIITHQDGAWYIRDLGSSNGTYLDGLRVNVDTMFTDGQTIALGTGIELRVHMSKGTTP
ncbi:MAG: FHA domain-containing protein [Roseiflexaceae bacterium]|jgi:pSer/pThr/pTyr-binding forkhead associated (FHA) protein|nr:FHA domain-containing protein [Chloroflexaceae bacterium]MCE2852455.1 FHA domain-containing protein [Chloroflexaceae bacterium]